MTLRDETRNTLVLCRLRIENTNGNYRVYIWDQCIWTRRRKIKKEKNRIWKNMMEMEKVDHYEKE